MNTKLTFKNKVTPITKVKVPAAKKVEAKYPKYVSNNGTGEELGTLTEAFQDDNNIEDGYSVDIEVMEAANSPSKYVSFDVAMLPNCCGVLEIGHLNVANTFPVEELTNLLDLSVQEAGGRTLIMNTNGKSDSIIFEMAIVKCKYWSLVKTFKNTTGNTIKMWVSNN